MANVFDAIRKHQLEADQAAQAAQAADAAQARLAPPEEVVQGSEGIAGSMGSPTPVQAAMTKAPRAAAASAAAAAPAAPASPADAAASNGNGYSEMLMAYTDRGGAIAEQYRALRTHLLAQYADERFCLVVTSAESGEGKTISSLNLALVLAERLERKTIVVDGDLRKGQIARHLNLDNSVGFGDLIAGSKTLSQAIQPTAYPNLSVIPAGRVEQAQVGSLVGRPETTEIIAELRRRYDYVLVDAPPISAASDAGMLGRATGEALLVVRMNKTSREAADRAIRLLKAANVRLVGLVLTHQRYYIPNYLYRYS